jgi:hypothetical protein
VPDIASACWQTAANAADCAGSIDGADLSGAVRVERLELAGEEGGAAGVALDLPATRLGNRAAADRHHRVEHQAVLFENRGLDGSDDRSQVTAVALDLVHEHEALRATLVDRECGAKAGCEHRVAFARRRFDVLGMMVEPRTMMRSSSLPVM